jgi:uncharacterized protein YndB with AHSA1/START domain
MAIEVTVGTTISRPIDEVFARITAIEDWPSWLIASGITAVRRSVSGPLTPGEQFTVEARAAGRAGSFEAVARTVEPPTRLVVEARDGDGVSIGIDARLAPASDGGTTDVGWSITIGLPFRYRIFEGMARPEVERAATLDLEALRRKVDAGPAE